MTRLVALLAAASGCASAPPDRRVASEDPPAQVVSRTVTDERLASARAWAALGRRRQAEQAFDEAVTAARKGIEVLGRDYAPPEAIDDTELKRAAAKDQYTRGRIDHAAEGLLRVLETRLGLYAARHPDDVDE